MKQLVIVLAAVALVAPSRVRADGSARQSAAGAQEDPAMARKQLVEELKRQGITDAGVLRAIEAVARHRFVPDAQQALAYADQPLAIGHGQTISQPYVVAFMTAAAHVHPGSNVLEVGTGSGYQTAVLAEVMGLGPGGAPAGSRLASMEILAPLADRAKAILKELGYDVTLRQGDGYAGWPERAPYDAIVVTAAPDHVPDPLEQQLAVGGRLVIPVGEGVQRLTVITRTEKGFTEETLLPVRFVPMTGEAERR